ncbi:MAG: DnaJ domain-containing protein [Candidatus Brocadiaceae bacterium]|nr:DnaJ domain-containing protein [Candidatus Brocadiaceae bacterium]
MINYYDVLEINESVSIEEIQRSFRTLIKKYHPDTNSLNKLWAESKTKIIIQAYKTLSDSGARKQYDKHYKNYSQTRHTSTYPNGKETADTNTIQSRLRIILIDLLHGKTTKAIRNYELLRKDFTSTDFFLYLNIRDYIDCKFLLAEAYEKSGNYEISVKFYELILNQKKFTPHRKHLTDEIKERIKNIYCRKLARHASPEKALNFYERALQFNVCKNENAFIYKKMAECYLKQKEFNNALKYLNIALSLKPNLQGINKLKTKLTKSL